MESIVIETGAKRGLSVACSGALILSFDTLLLRLIYADPLQVAFWRGMLMFVVGLCVFMVRRVRGNLSLSLTNGWIGFTVAVFYGFASICFVTSAMMTSIANMLAIIGERTPRRTWGAVLTALSGIVVVVWPSLSSEVNGGDIVALLTAWSMAGAFLLSRRMPANLAFAPATGGLLSAIVLAPFVREFSFARLNQVLLMTFEGGVLLPLVLGLVTTAPKYLPAPQVGLFLLLEAVFGRFWTWTILGEIPPPYALTGGTIVILTLAGHTALMLWPRQQAANRTVLIVRPPQRDIRDSAYAKVDAGRLPRVPLGLYQNSRCKH